MRKRNFEHYCDDFENIENYEKALADNFIGWECHHRLETHTSDGERRLVDISQAELIALNMYYNRPANELIFMTKSEHSQYNKGKQRSEEQKKKMKGREPWNKDKKGLQTAWNKGIPMNDEQKHIASIKSKELWENEEYRTKQCLARKGIPSPRKGSHHTEESKQKMRESHKGQVAWNKGTKMSEEFKKNVSDGVKRQMEEVREAYKKSGRKDWNTFQKEYKNGGK